MTQAMNRIEKLLATGCYRLAEVREFLPIKLGVPKCWAAVMERVAGEPDDTYENVIVELKTLAEQEWAREKIQSNRIEG